ncbi:hypothetical protein SRABI106_04397 [Rahnella aquatilis]|nr:hypothetical protein SRABI106_04397 [Rahnella aquatilis]
MAAVPKITTVATATVTFSALAFSTGSVAITAAAPQMLLPAPISIAVSRSSLNTRCPSQQARAKVEHNISASITIPVAPTSAICAKVSRKP